MAALIRQVLEKRIIYSDVHVSDRILAFLKSLFRCLNYNHTVMMYSPGEAKQSSFNFPYKLLLALAHIGRYINSVISLVNQSLKSKNRVSKQTIIYTL